MLIIFESSFLQYFWILTQVFIIFLVDFLGHLVPCTEYRAGAMSTLVRDGGREVFSRGGGSLRVQVGGEGWAS